MSDIWNFDQVILNAFESKKRRDLQAQAQKDETQYRRDSLREQSGFHGKQLANQAAEIDASSKHQEAMLIQAKRQADTADATQRMHQAAFDAENARAPLKDYARYQKTHPDLYTAIAAMVDEKGTVPLNRVEKMTGLWDNYEARKGTESRFAALQRQEADIVKSNAQIAQLTTLLKKQAPMPADVPPSSAFHFTEMTPSNVTRFMGGMLGGQGTALAGAAGEMAANRIINSLKVPKPSAELEQKRAFNISANEQNYNVMSQIADLVTKRGQAGIPIEQGAASLLDKVVTFGQTQGYNVDASAHKSFLDYFDTLRSSYDRDAQMKADREMLKIGFQGQQREEQIRLAAELKGGK
jgi:hypothetical protein